MDADELIRKTRISLEVGRTTMAPDDFTPARLADAVARFDASVRLSGLDPDLDAEQLDLDKVAAFVDGLPCLPGSMLALLSGRTLRLNLPGLELHTSSAVTVETLRAGYGLEPDPTAANPHLAPVRLAAAPSASLARSRIARSAKAVDERDALLRPLTGQSETPETLREAARLRQERRSAAMVWASLADRLLRHDANDRWAAAEAAAARRALASESVGPAGGGMP
ncbi:hypothetical protein HL658_08095 [Azospirillum sp. RWY-5-1]|uniref:Uncharacterized protein n=1 Tax=Azospirillum oleiclasticum TaxID=2735135 RepID=A0ABX2T952_9PROT|nr:hypothetical protein [Azospirillum oleiclasticum]NYZ12508.1 hypothetical protein [Azospirillum oleiclasticum]NYZ19668.1 hypothetical protein [Azospirillum oleiclasticum]